MELLFIMTSNFICNSKMKRQKSKILAEDNKETCKCIFELLQLGLFSFTKIITYWSIKYFLLFLFLPPKFFRFMDILLLSHSTKKFEEIVCILLNFALEWFFSLPRQLKRQSGKNLFCTFLSTLSPSWEIAYSISLAPVLFSYSKSIFAWWQMVRVQQNASSSWNTEADLLCCSIAFFPLYNIKPALCRLS